MHDLHRPFACGPPSKDQPCASVENEHSTKEKVSCNKLFPRKIIEPGTEEVAEDPRRRELYRLWLTRNCHFLNNYVPIILLAMDSNMDFQATLTCDAVIEYMTKYMTKAGHGSLIRVMEHSFSLCIEKTIERGYRELVLQSFDGSTFNPLQKSNPNWKQCTSFRARPGICAVANLEISI